jgi:hypothetical protein
MLFSKRTSEKMKDTLRFDPGSVASIIFFIPFDKASDDVKEIWEWIVLQVFPIINFQWKLRVNAGAQGKASGKSLLDIITASDIALSYTMIEWYGRRGIEDEVKHVPDLMHTVGYKEDDDSVDGDRNEEMESNVETYIRSDRFIGKENSDKPGRRGRKKGEEGFASTDNVRRFNEHGMRVEALFYHGPNIDYIRTWVEAAMSWVNREVVALDDDESNCGYTENTTVANKVVPFVLWMASKIQLYPV